MKTRIISINQPQAIATAVTWIRSFQPVAFPTDTVYGLGAALESVQAIDRLFEVKGREAEKAIAVLLGDPADLALVTAEMSRMAECLARIFWPGALTLVVERHPDLPANLAPRNTIGVRMPDLPFALELLRTTGPLAVTSANLSGGPNTVTAQEVYDQLSERIPLILDGGRTPGGSPSTVVDCTADEPCILRPGPITLEMITAALD
jgi:L-threonylcarbamoyladenylate synthase